MYQYWLTDTIMYQYWLLLVYLLGFPGGSDGKESACSVGDLGLIPGLTRSPGEGNGYSLQYSGLENSMDYSLWCAKSRTQLSDFPFTNESLGHFIKKF